MLAVKGTYQNGEVRLEQKIITDKPIPVIVTFIDDIDNIEDKQFNPESVSFKQAREILSEYKGSLSDAVIEERRKDL